MCEAYFVCLFLPIQLTVFGKMVLGMNFLFIPLMGGEVPQTFVYSLAMAAVPLFTLIFSLAKRPPAFTLYISFILFFVLGAVFVCALSFGFGNGFGLAVCAAESVILCILSVVRVYAYDDSEEIRKAENERIMREFNENMKKRDAGYAASGAKQTKCAFCGRVLYGTEQCDCVHKKTYTK